MKFFSLFALFSLTLWAMDIPAPEQPRINFQAVSTKFSEYLDQNIVSPDARALQGRFEGLLLLLSSKDQTISHLEKLVTSNEDCLRLVQSGLKKHIEYAEVVWEDTFSRLDLTEEAKDKQLKDLRDEHQIFLRTIEDYKLLIVNHEYEIELSRRHRSFYISALERISDTLEEFMCGAISSTEVDDFGLEPGEIIDVPIYPLNLDWETRKVLILRSIRKPSTIEYALTVKDAKDVAASFAQKGLCVLVVKYDPSIVKVFDNDLPSATFDTYNLIPDSHLKYGVLHMTHPDISEHCPKRSKDDNERERDLIPNLRGMQILRQMICFQFSFALDHDYNAIVVDLGYPAAHFLCSSVYHSIYQHYIRLFSGCGLKNVVFANNGTQDQIIIDDEATTEEISTEDTEEF